MSATAPALDESIVLTQYRRKLCEWALAGQQRCLLMIDAARYDEREVLKSLYTYDDNPHWSWLFDNTPFAKYRDAGPVLVETTLDSRLCSHVVAQWADDGAVAIVVTEQRPDVAMSGFRQSLMVHLPTHGPCMLRPYDGRFLETLSACLPEALDSLIGKGNRLIWAVDHGEATQWSSVQGISAEAKGLQAHLGISLEGLLGWVLAWSRCTAIAMQHEHTLHHTAQRIRALWSAGHACPESDAELVLLWPEMELAAK